jgi:hypothetical protein
LQQMGKLEGKSYSLIEKTIMKMEWQIFNLHVTCVGDHQVEESLNKKKSLQDLGHY